MMRSQGSRIRLGTIDQSPASPCRARCTEPDSVIMVHDGYREGKGSLEPGGTRDLREVGSGGLVPFIIPIIPAFDRVVMLDPSEPPVDDCSSRQSIASHTVVDCIINNSIVKPKGNLMTYPLPKKESKTQDFEKAKIAPVLAGVFVRAPPFSATGHQQMGLSGEEGPGPEPCPRLSTILLL